ncbi:MAG: mannose-1-phosphate guanylyltransferase/mannose-6-phosphate isomerase [Rhodospirillaceae bacterium]|nr:mannose-1-phosphate guanylyltransferase/mannose-6-phosphate isomerase [Rhodospirillaceae bacterium]MBT5038178.1 mannose-1-phosphate guanylyltransferase/mannose-6-phosphate isomerase [Rhodospirillaceae bacterium]MBT5674146.1 mannose-1-phosphate guanylyltransferase/mannose-6-phosphate isomerase [Rhodospirillaceae bacterium]
MAAKVANIHPVILCGGSGTRLWPLSRAEYPKQLLRLIGDNTMVQDTAKRFSGPGFAAPLFLCNEAHRFILAEQMRQIDIEPARIVLEPVGRNTAPAAAIAALMLTAQDSDALMLISPADHVITDPGGLAAAIHQAAALAADGSLVTFGITPDAPETGYGYILEGDAIAGGPCHKVTRFVEKPDAARAQEYLAAGGYLWNSGMFLFSAAHYLSELERLQPDMVSACRAALGRASAEQDFLRLDEAPFAAMTGDSIDYAVMEDCEQAAVMPINVGWSDVGSWRALWQVAARGDGDNLIEGDVIALDCKSSYIRSDGPLIAALGLEDIAVVATKDAILIAPKDKAEAVKDVVAILSAQDRGEAVSHTRVVRPWGAFEGLRHGPGFQVKLLTVNPGAGISLQYHNKRAEHWVVVAGRARVTRDAETLELNANQSTFIATGVHHRLENPGSEPLHVVEVQSGDYLGEDDIVRIEDRYGRS